jgi:hypothetical protein
MENEKPHHRSVRVEGCGKSSQLRLRGVADKERDLDAAAKLSGASKSFRELQLKARVTKFEISPNVSWPHNPEHLSFSVSELAAVTCHAKSYRGNEACRRPPKRQGQLIR